jgi:diketogulonate reductase-like aldo/keto reductase
MTVLTRTVRTLSLPAGEAIPALGRARMAEDPRRRKEEIEALRFGIDLGMTLIDTAEMYADGAAEQLVGEAIEGFRDDVFLVSKVLPHHATVRGTIEACERSLARLGVDELDLYLLHWRGAVPLEETLEAFDTLVGVGKIRNWGVSNFDLPDMEELVNLPEGSSVSTDQVLYNLEHRGIEFDLLPWCERGQVPIMAYSPIEQGELLRHPILTSVAARHEATPAQAALAWCCATRTSAPSRARPSRCMFGKITARLTSACRLLISPSSTAPFLCPHASSRWRALTGPGWWIT